MSSFFAKKRRGTHDERNKYDDKILEAVLGNDPAKLKAALEKHKYSSLSAVDESGRTPLLEACRLGYDEILEQLLVADADVTIADEQGRNGLHIAAMNGHSKCLALLLRKGAQKSSLDDNRMTALHHAAIAGHNDVVQMLIANQCDTEIRDKEGNTPLLSACAAKQRQPVVALMNASANINASNSSQKTALMFACENGAADLAQMLLARGAAVDKQDAQGMTARSYAQSGNHKAVLDVLPANAPLGRTPSVAGALGAGIDESAVRSLKQRLDEEVKARQAAQDEVNVLKLQLASYQESGETPAGEDDDVNFDSDDDIDLGDDEQAGGKSPARSGASAADKARIAELEAENADLKAQLENAQPAGDSDEVEELRSEISQLKAALEKDNVPADAQQMINVYRHHLLLAVEGKLSDDVAESLKQIISLRKKESDS